MELTETLCSAISSSLQVMQAQEVGLLDINAPIHIYVDPVMQRLNGTTMLDLWNGDRTVLNVTAKDLMGEPLPWLSTSTRLFLFVLTCFFVHSAVNKKCHRLAQYQFQ
jgi:hypothetical protein